MNPKFRIPIYVLSVGLPLILLLVGFVVLNNVNQSGEKEFKVRAQNYSRVKSQQKQVSVLESKIENLSSKGEDWEKLLASSDVGAVTSLIQGISEGRALEEFKRSDFNFVGRATGVGAVSEQPSVSFDLGLSGNYANLQEGLLAMEARMPNLVMNSMKLSPDRKGETLNLKLAYSAWSN